MFRMNRNRSLASILGVHTGDTTPPTVTITCTQGSSGLASALATLNFTFTLSEVATDFVVGDITVGGVGGTKSNFAGSGASYTCDIAPTEPGLMTVSIASGAFHDAAGNGNTVSSTFNVYCTRLSLVSGLVYWYDFSDITTLWQDTGRTNQVTANNQSIAGLSDKANSNVMSQATGTKQPTYKTNIQNGLSAASGDGGDVLAMDSAPTWGIASSGQGPWWFMVVWKRNSSGAGSGLDTLVSHSQPDFYYRNSTNDKATMVWSGTKEFGTSYVDNTAYITEYRRSSNTFTHTVNGVDDATTQTYTPGFAFGVAGSAKAYLFADSAGGSDFGLCYLCEVFLFNVLPSSTVRDNIRAAMNAKWAVF